MNDSRWQRIEDIFHEASELPRDEREAFLDRSCAGDADLRGEVASLLESIDAAGAFMTDPVATQGMELLAESCHDPFVGRVIGPYRLLRQIGEGGMGAVYLAERADDQFQKRVAIKLMRIGAADPFLLNRFHTERQILASLEHPNIARLLDGGTLPDGSPFIVMEFIEGLPIEEYCDEHRLPVVRRLELFLDVCSAVQYAHQHLVIHRDIKDSNILVTADGVPKLLDFGIAKLLEAQPPAVAEQSQTSTRMLLTPDYASPEQARGEAMTTRSDVYSLGVLLYRLLTGRRPYELGGLNPAEAMIAIGVVEPAKPSTAVIRPRGSAPDLDSADPSPEEAAVARQSSSEGLRRHLRGDLDNVVLMALRKEARLRYASVEQFAADIRRHLEGHPVVARPGTVAYRTAKFVSRHRTAVVAAGLVLLAVAAGILSTIRQADIAAEERDRARIEARKAEQVTAFLQGMLTSADPREGGRAVTVAGALDEAAQRVDRELTGQPEIEAAVRTSIGLTYMSLGLYDAAEPQLKKALETRVATLGPDDAEVATSLRNLSLLLSAKGDVAAAEPLIRQALTAAGKASGTESVDVAACQNALAELLLRKGDMAGAEQLHRESLAIRRKLLGEQHADVAESLNDLAVVLGTKGDNREAGQLHEQALAVIRALKGPEHPDVAVTLSNLAGVKAALGDHAAAERMFQEALALRRKLLGPEHPDVAYTLFNFAYMMFDQRKYAEAAGLSREVLALRGRVLPMSTPWWPGRCRCWGGVSWRRGAWRKRSPCCERASSCGRRPCRPGTGCSPTRRASWGSAWDAWGSTPRPKLCWSRATGGWRRAWGQRIPGPGSPSPA